MDKVKRITCGTVEKSTLEGKKLFGVCGIDTEKGTFQFDVELSYLIKSPTEFKFDAVVTEPKETSFIERLKKEFK